MSTESTVPQLSRFLGQQDTSKPRHKCDKLREDVTKKCQVAFNAIGDDVRGYQVNATASEHGTEALLNKFNASGKTEKEAVDKVIGHIYRWFDDKYGPDESDSLKAEIAQLKAEKAIREEQDAEAEEKATGSDTEQPTQPQKKKSAVKKKTTTKKPGPKPENEAEDSKPQAKPEAGSDTEQPDDSPADAG